MKKHYEVISYDGQNFKFTVGAEHHCAPHIHREIEFGIILDGDPFIKVNGQTHQLKKGDLWLINSCQSHEVFCLHPAQAFTYVELQMSLSFFKSYFPEIAQVEFSQTSLTKETIGEQNHRTLTELLINSTLCYLRQETRFALKCAAMINLLFDSLLEAIPYRLLDPQEMQIANLRKGRVQRIAAYIEENYDQKLLLSDLARQEQLSMPHLSHFFTKNFGMSFQDYLLHQRCQKAQKMLSSTDISLGDVSLACGFSSARYMDKGFRQIYGMSPKEYRLRHKNQFPANVPAEKHLSPRDIRQFTCYTPEESASILHNFLSVYLQDIKQPCG